jgi:hypothetical protein
MAKKRKRQEEKKEELEYKPPEFDRLGYVKTEVGVSKATIIAALFAIPMGLAAMFVMPVGGVAGGFLAGLGGMSVLWFLLPMLKIDVRSFKWTQSAGVLSTHFLVFLAVWVVACNPPFNDFASPTVSDVQVSWGWGSVYVNETASGNIAKIPGNVTEVTVTAQVTDNVGILDGTVNITRGSQVFAMVKADDEGHYTYAFSNVVPVENFSIGAVDINGKVNSGYTFSIVY